MKKIALIGLGYVGLATAVTCAESKKNNKYNYSVKGIELNNKKGRLILETFKQKKSPYEINDKNFNRKLKKILKLKLLTVELNYNSLNQADIVIVSINCDINKRTKKTTLKKFLECIKKISLNIQEKCLVIVQSTLPPGTTENKILPLIKKIFIKRKLNCKNILLSYSFERVTPGKNYIDSIKNSYRVFSGINKSSEELTKRFLSNIINTKKYPLSKLQNTTEAETCKIIENSYRAINIAFINEWRQFSDRLNLDLNSIIKAIKLRKTHNNIMSSGLGVGGYCLTKDPLFGTASSLQVFKKKFDFPFSNQAVEINNMMPYQIMKNIDNFFGNKLRKKKVIIFGVSYKENVGDTRFSPSAAVFDFFKKKKCNIDIYDPLAKFWQERKIQSLEKVLMKSYDVVVFAVKHSVFLSTKLNLKKNAIVLDLNNVLTKSQVNKVNKRTKNCFLLGKKNNLKI